MMKNLLAVLCLYCHITSKINIWEPKSLKNLYSNREFPYTVMNFGTIPYGHTLYGTVFQASPFEACAPLDPLKWDKNYGTLILLVERGGCNFSEKALNAQKIGAGMVFIIDNNLEDVHRIFPIERSKEMLDLVHIPSLLISKQDGDNILNALNSPGRKPHDNQIPVVELALHFEMVKMNHRGNVKIILQVDDFRSYDLLLDFFKYYTKFGIFMNLSIHYKLFKNPSGYFESDDCLSEAKAPALDQQTNTYCVSKSFGNTKKDLHLVEETFTQICLKYFDINTYVKYMGSLRSSCFNEGNNVVDNFSSCASKVLATKLDSKLKKSIDSCTKQGSIDWSNAIGENIDNIKYYLINYAPLIFLNGFYYKGNYDDVTHLFEAFCNGFDSPPKPCYDLEGFQSADDMNTHKLNRFVLLSALFCIVIAVTAIVLFYIIYKKKIKKKFNFDLNDKINEALAKFYSEEEKDEASSKEEIKKEDVSDKTKDHKVENGN